MCTCLFQLFLIFLSEILFHLPSVATRNVTMLPNGPIEVSVGDAVTIDCFAEGNPLPFVHIRRQKGGANRKFNSLPLFQIAICKKFVLCAPLALFTASYGEAVTIY